jgi:hypothetical protein
MGVTDKKYKFNKTVPYSQKEYHLKLINGEHDIPVFLLLFQGYIFVGTQEEELSTGKQKYMLESEDSMIMTN